MRKNIKHPDIRNELDAARTTASGLGRNGRPETIEAWWEVCCGLVLLAEENLMEHRMEWEVSSLAREFLDIADYLEGYDHMLGRLEQATGRMTAAVYGHPRLKLGLLRFRLGIIHRIEALRGAELGAGEELMSEISFFQNNISLADKGEYDKIKDKGHIKNDPVEWSAGYENIIDEADKKIDTMLSGYPKGMGYCNAYWHAKTAVLAEDYGIRWKSPSLLNPGVMFD